VPIEGAGHIAARLRQIEHEAMRPLFIDGEWQVDGGFDATLAHFMAGAARGNRGALHVFDVMPLKAWRGEWTCDPLERRRVEVDRLFGGDRNAMSGVHAMPWSWAADVIEVESAAREYIAKGGEGVVAKVPVAPYRRGRSGLWQKLKRHLSLDLEIVDFRLHPSKPSVEAIVVGHGQRRVTVTAGISAVDALALWHERGRLIGAIAEISAMERTDAGSLRHPRLLRMRWDREEA